MTTGFYLSYIALWALVIALTLVLIGVVRSVYRMQLKVPRGFEEEEGLPAGFPVPEFSVLDLEGNQIDNTSLAGRVSALLFVSPLCTSCAVTLAELQALQSKTGGNVVVFCRAGAEACTDLAERYGLSVPVVVDERLQISELFNVLAPPTAVLVDEDGRIQTYGHPMKVEDLETLLTSENGAPAQLVQEAS